VSGLRSSMTPCQQLPMGVADDAAFDDAPFDDAATI